MTEENRAPSIIFPGTSSEKDLGKPPPTNQAGGGDLRVRESSTFSTMSETISGPIVEQWNYRQRGYGGCSNPVAGFILCCLACVAILVMFFFFYPMSTSSGAVKDSHKSEEMTEEQPHDS